MTAAAGAGVLLAGLVSGALVAAPAPAPRFESTVRPLLSGYCYACHTAAVKKGEVDLASFKTEASLAGKPAVWREVLKQLRAHTMPPEKAPQPTEAERQVLTEWLDGALQALDARAPRDPGRAPIRRLNRVEYSNTIRDLTGLDLAPAEDFPADDTAYGFDNVGEALSLSPILLEKYLDAAERVLDKAIVTDGPLTALQGRWEGEALPRAQATDGAAELALEREVAVPAEVPADGDYEITVRAWQRGAGSEPATLVFRIDGVDAHIWYLNGEAPLELRATVPLRKGSRVSLRHTWHMSLPGDQKPPDARLFVDRISIEGPARVLAHRRLFFVEPGPALPEREAARQVVGRFATAAFRRPVQPDELTRLLGLYDRARASGRPYVEAVRLSLLSTLVSPQFLFRVERGSAQRDAYGSVRLTDWELASRLSYFLWSTMPDAELFRLAESAKLHEDAVLRAQVRRMLQDPKSAALAENFAGQWLGIRKLETAQPDPDLFPAYKPGLRQAMAAEPLLFFQAVQREDRSILEFVNADWTYLNEDLARHYGLRGITGGYMRKVPLAGTPRGGVITMAAVLTVTSHPTRTSAVKRGKWVLEEILGAPPPPPPPNVPALETPPKGQAPATTLRERLERHRADPRCSGCHVRMDALGLGLENFDAIGRWREKEGGHPIDASGTLPDGSAFSGPAQLRQVLAGQGEEFARNLVQKMLVYALGRGLQPQDGREVKRITEALRQNGWRFSTLVTEVVESYPFQYRQAPPPSPKPTTAPGIRKTK